MYYSYRQRSHCTSRHCTFYLHMSIYVFAVHAGWDFVNENLSNSFRFPLKSETDIPIKEKHWTILCRDDCSIDPSYHHIILKIVGFKVIFIYKKTAFHKLSKFAI